MKSIGSGAVLTVALLASACAEPSGAKTPENTGAFVYSPTLGAPYQLTMTRYEEMSIPGTPVRDAQRWTLDWQVVSSKESNLFKRTLKLVGLKLDVNGVDELRGDEIKATSPSIDVLTDKDANVVDVRGTEQLSTAIVGLGAPEAQPVLKKVFSPERLKALVVVRNIEQGANFVGHPSQVGSQWTVSAPDAAGAIQFRVVSETPCGTRKCVQVERTYDIDKQAVFAEVASRVADYVQSQGGDPKEVKLTNAEVKLQDSLVIEPSSMDYFGARFDQDATIHVAGPNGELPVAFKLHRQSDYKY
ncbi:MAG TPA: hypothetical protein VFK05_33770 [Polyangiaceae bacterium]|nr:hypothetical protein [Polyangiaceae bacterium]